MHANQAIHVFKQVPTRKYIKKNKKCDSHAKAASCENLICIFLYQQKKSVVLNFLPLAWKVTWKQTQS